MTKLLLTGAGFSRNWGGWLANEAFEYLLGCSELDVGLRDLLWAHVDRGDGFEGALGELQTRGPENDSLHRMEGAIAGMFNLMNSGLAPFDDQHLTRRFLARFDAIFTLNIDTLLERQYLHLLDQTIAHRWTGAQIPGMRCEANPNEYSGSFNDGTSGFAQRWVPDERALTASTDSRFQQYFKLHGSSNWFDRGNRLMVVGGNKPKSIASNPVLKFHNAQFSEMISRPDARLMIVGYSFGDEHINSAIAAAAKTGNLRIFIVDPAGVDILDKRKRSVQLAAIKIPFAGSGLLAELNSALMGASRRDFRATIEERDRVELRKLSKFFDI